MKLPIGPSYQPQYDQRYDWAEIQVCVEYPDNAGGTYVEALGDLSAEAEARAKDQVASGEALRWFYSVYWHLSDGGVECIGDFYELDSAQRVYAALMCAVCMSRELRGDARAFAKFATRRD